MATSRMPCTRTSLTTAEALEAAIDALIAKPTEDNLKAARTAWLAARVPYQQTEGYRFGNADRRRLGGQGECLAARRGPDRLCRPRPTATSSDENPLYTANVIANTQHPHRRRDGRRHARSPRSCWRQAAGSRRRRSQCRHRLSRHRIPAVGPGSERHRPGRRQPSRPPTTTPPIAPTAIATAAPPI